MRRLRLGEGDVVAIQRYFKKMQTENDVFFFSIDLDEEGQLQIYFGQIQEAWQSIKTLEMLSHLMPHTLQTSMTCHLLIL